MDEGTEYRLVLDLPGVTKDQLEIGPGPVEGTLSIRAQGREERPAQGALRSERGAAGAIRYERVVPVAWDADVAKAKPVLSDGVLTVAVPKKSTKKQPEDSKK